MQLLTRVLSLERCQVLMNITTSSFDYEEIATTASPVTKNERYNQSASATNASWAVNWFLLFVKLYAFVASSSKAIAAALVDSAGNEKRSCL